MNGYKAFYKGREIDVYAETSYKAQVKAAGIFKARKAYEVQIGLCVLNVNTDQAREVIHAADF